MNSIKIFLIFNDTRKNGRGLKFILKFDLFLKFLN